MDIALFPLNMVLFPGGVLPLRIFEPRYLDMVSHCMKNNCPFAVVSITKGQEAGSNAQFTDLGTLAKIVDFDQLQDGLLGITCTATERIVVKQNWHQDDGLNMGTVSLLPAEPKAQIDTSHAQVVRFLRQLLTQEGIRDYRQWLTEDWTDSSWVGYRIAELLPLPIALKIGLLEMEDAPQRLHILARILQDNQLLEDV